jgi:hypothetical protein
MAALAITVADDASPEDQESAAEIGPDLVGAPGPLAHMVRASGFQKVSRFDWTDAFEETCERFVRTRADLEHELRKVEGDETYEREVRKKEGFLDGIRTGLLRRTLVVGEAPLV